MTTSLATSRDFLARAMTRLRAGASNVEREAGQTGPESDYHIDPFGPGQATTAAGLLKLGTSVARSMRRRANADSARETAGLEREKVRGEIARMRAEQGWYERRGTEEKQATPRAKAHLENDVGRLKGGQDYDPAEISTENSRLNREATEKRERDRRTGQVTAARAALAGMDADAKRELAGREALLRVRVGRAINNLASGDEKTRKAAEAELGFTQGAPDAQKKFALENIYKRFRSVHGADIDAYNRPRRAPYEQVIKDAAQPRQAEAPADTSDDDPVGYFNQ